MIMKIKFGLLNKKGKSNYHSIIYLKWFSSMIDSKNKLDKFLSSFTFGIKSRKETQTRLTFLRAI